MKQLILPEDYSGESLYSLSSGDSHYIINVQRKEIGYKLNLLDSQGNRYNGTIVDIVNGECLLQLTKSGEVTDNLNKIILFQSIPKGQKIDLMIRQAVEAGVYEIVPIMADHSVPQFKTSQDREKKRDRWNKIIKEASQQSGTESLTKLSSLQTFKEALDNLEKPYTGIYFHQVPLENRSLHSLLQSPEKNIVLVIGPEGGLSGNEVKLLDEYGFKPALLGQNILRAETATTFALGAVSMLLFEKDEWVIKK